MLTLNMLKIQHKNFNKKHF